MRQTKRTPTPPTAMERDAHARTYSYTLDGTVVSLTQAALKQHAIHRRDAVSAIHVGANEEGLILPQPIYWPGNRLTLRGLSDPAVQVELVRMEQRQADYMRHIHLLLRTTLTDRQLRSGNKAILDALPEKEREQARAWATTGIWPKVLRWVSEEGERRSRRDFKRWVDARKKADGSRFGLAAKAASQLEKWPLDLSAQAMSVLEQDASQHRTRLAALEQARSQGIA